MPACLAAVQPPAPTTPGDLPAAMAAGWRLAEAAADRGARLAVLPECFNVLGLPPAEVPGRAAEAERVLDGARELCASRDLWLLLPLVQRREGRLRNLAHLLAPSGEIALTYEKTHLTLTEREGLGLVPGDSVPVADTPFGRVGVMICYDVYFPEVARLLFLQRVDLLLFPSLQRSDTPERCLLLNRARAIDTASHLVRAAWALPAGEPYAPGKVYGGSCVVAPDGEILAQLGMGEGFALAEVDLGTPWSRPRCNGGAVQPVRDFLAADRRPELYGPLAAAPGAEPPPRPD